MKRVYAAIIAVAATVYLAVFGPGIYAQLRDMRPSTEIITPAPPPPVTKISHYYLGPWVWENGEWQAPAGTTGLIDLRGITDTGTPEKAHGYGFFKSTAKLDAPYVDLGYDLDQVVPVEKWVVCTADKNDSVLNLLWKTLTIWADPTGIERNGPLMPYNGVLSITIDAETTESRDWEGENDPAWPTVKESLQVAYRNAPGKVRPKLLTDWREQFEIYDVKEFIPPDLPVIEAAPKETSYSESFDTADSTTLGPSYTWAEYLADFAISSNTAINSTTATLGSARLDSDMSSADHWAEIVLSIFSDAGSTTTEAHACARFGSTLGVPFYYSARRKITFLTASWALCKTSGSTITRLSATDTTRTLSLPETIRCTVHGSTISISIGGSVLETLTDTTYASGTRGGIAIYDGKFAGTANCKIDSFAESDLATGVAVLVDGPMVRSLIDGGLVQ